MCPPTEIKIFTLETACPIKNFIRLSLHHRRRKRLILPTIQCFQGFLALLRLRHRPIRSQVLCQIGNDIAGGLDGAGGPREAGSGSGVDAGSMVYKVRSESRVGPDLLIGEIAG